SADYPAVLQYEAGGDAEALADQPGHAVEHEIAEEEADHHQGGAKHDVEEQAPAFDGASVQAVPAHGHMGEHPERDRDHRFADEDNPAADAGHPHDPRDHRQHVSDADPGQEDSEQSSEDRRREEAHDCMAGN